jgi:hypothetical protein
MAVVDLNNCGLAEFNNLLDDQLGSDPDIQLFQVILKQG